MGKELGHDFPDRTIIRRSNRIELLQTAFLQCTKRRHQRRLFVYVVSNVTHLSLVAWRGRVSSGVTSLYPYTTLLLVVYKAQIPYQLADISVVDDEAFQDIADGCSHQ